jgi:hypothetical protein
MTSMDVFEHWDLSVFQGAFLEDSLFNAKPLYDFIETQFKDIELKKKLNIGIVNLNNGNS